MEVCRGQQPPGTGRQAAASMCWAMNSNISLAPALGAKAFAFHFSELASAVLTGI